MYIYIYILLQKIHSKFQNLLLQVILKLRGDSAIPDCKDF